MPCASLISSSRMSARIISAVATPASCSQRTNDLIERRPRYPGCHQVDLEGADILKFETIGGPGRNSGSTSLRR
jgi:hypothetical protein